VKAHGIRLGYYYHGRDGREIHLIFGCCLLNFASMIICLQRQIRNFDQVEVRDDFNENMGPVHTLDYLYFGWINYLPSAATKALQLIYFNFGRRLNVPHFIYL